MCEESLHPGDAASKRPIEARATRLIPWTRSPRPLEGLEPSREIALVRSAGRAPSRVAEAFLAYARERL